MSDVVIDEPFKSYKYFVFRSIYLKKLKSKSKEKSKMEKIQGKYKFESKEDETYHREKLIKHFIEIIQEYGEDFWFECTDEVWDKIDSVPKTEKSYWEEISD